ncbi:MAG: metalloendopeptidase [Magnetospirillum sp.]|nr:metalloendopeptidase [Magnetospirillum sp.]
MDFSKLAKVLALAASDNQTEALHALATAKRLLEAEGADFVELARRLAEAEAGAGDAVDREVLEDAIFDLRNEIRHLRSENERLKQARGGAGPLPAEPASLHEAARAAADTIRMRAELEQLTGALEHERAEVARLAAQQAALRQAQAEGAAAATRLAEAEARRMRLEAENRRLLHANHALTVELEEARALKPIPFDVIARHSRPEPKPNGKLRAKPGANQYALF